VWDSAAFSSIFLASGFSCSQTESTPAHTQVTQAVSPQKLNIIGMKRIIVESKAANDKYQGLLGLDRWPQSIRALTWVAGLILATSLANSVFFHVIETISATSISKYFLLLSIISPICIAIAILRLVGIKWRHGFLLFIFVPMIIYGRILAFGILYGLMGD
jgi:hypothetical protein